MSTSSEMYSLRVNGTEQHVKDAWIGESLLYVLRERLGFMGAKGACEQGECGSCTVLINNDAVCSCLVMAASAIDTDITTVEGLATTETPNDIQQAFVTEGAVQCGFCTPGLIVAVHHLLETNSSPSEIEVKEALSGNICRCTGYGRIFSAVQLVISQREKSIS
ncbi:MAG: (2Fe-2S)-binding protein [Ilumatobacteraceae bacterium]|nr:(2Fe-2S)-binding protein [Ilumatobacteraceae bacterium]